MFTELIGYLIFGGFWFIMGIALGLHRAEMQDIESKRKGKYTSD